MYKQLFSVGLIVSLPLMGCCTHFYRNHFARLGSLFDEMDALMQSSAGYSVHQTGTGITIKLDTGNKLNSDAIDIQTSEQAARITINGQDSKTQVRLQAENGYVIVGMCSQESRKRDQKKEESSETREIFAGSSCMQQVIPARVNFDAITADYEGTVLTITVPTYEPAAKKTRKVAVNMKEEAVSASAQQVETHVKKHKNIQVESVAPVAPETLHEK